MLNYSKVIYKTAKDYSVSYLVPKCFSKMPMFCVKSRTSHEFVEFEFSRKTTIPLSNKTPTFLQTKKIY